MILPLFSCYVSSQYMADCHISHLTAVAAMTTLQNISLAVYSAVDE